MMAGRLAAAAAGTPHVRPPPGGRATHRTTRSARRGPVSAPRHARAAPGSSPTRKPRRPVVVRITHVQKADYADVTIVVGTRARSHSWAPSATRLQFRAAGGVDRRDVRARGRGKATRRLRPRRVLPAALVRPECSRIIARAGLSAERPLLAGERSALNCDRRQFQFWPAAPAVGCRLPFQGISIEYVRQDTRAWPGRRRAAICAACGARRGPQLRTSPPRHKGTGSPLREPHALLKVGEARAHSTHACPCGCHRPRGNRGALASAARRHGFFLRPPIR